MDGYQQRCADQLRQAYLVDLRAAATAETLAAVDPVPFYVAAGENAWAGVKAHLDTVTERIAAPIIAKYTGVLAAADIETFTISTTFQIMQSLRLDRGVTVSIPVPPDHHAPGPGQRSPGAGLTDELATADALPR